MDFGDIFSLSDDLFVILKNDKYEEKFERKNSYYLD